MQAFYNVQVIVSIPPFDILGFVRRLKMTVIEHWKAFYAAFEASALDQNWARIAPFLTEDVQYRVSGVPFACVIKGRSAVVDGFARSFAGFDTRFDKRTHMVTATRLYPPGHIEANIWGIYEKAGLPVLAFPAIGNWHFDGDKIGLMVDIYDASLLEIPTSFEWLENHAIAMGGLDPTYA
jgi:hypothetical protein